MPLDADTMLIIGLALIAAGLALFFVEVLIPSGGLITIFAFICAVVGVVFLFKHSVVWGLSGMLAVMVLGPMVFMFGLKVLPSTPIGRRMFGDMPEELVETEKRAREDHARKLAVLVDRVGTAITPLRPIGTIEIDGERYEALAELGAVDRGDAVRVSAIVDGQVKVRLHTADTTA